MAGEGQQRRSIWQGLREPRTATALLSALLALIFGALELRALLAAQLAGSSSSEPDLPSILAIGLVSLAGSLVALRRGNLVFLLVAWAFVLGNRFVALLRFREELASAAGNNLLLAVLSANFDLILLVAGAALGFAAAFFRRSRAGRVRT